MKTAHFFISNALISNATKKLTKNQGKAKQHPEIELLLFENYSLFSPSLSSKNNGRYCILNNIQKTNASVLMRLYD